MSCWSRAQYIKGIPRCSYLGEPVAETIVEKTGEDHVGISGLFISAHLHCLVTPRAGAVDDPRILDECDHVKALEIQKHNTLTCPGPFDHIFASKTIKLDVLEVGNAAGGADTISGDVVMVMVHSYPSHARHLAAKQAHAIHFMSAKSSYVNPILHHALRIPLGKPTRPRPQRAERASSWSQAT